jgi:hypothetical protein
MDLDRRRTDSTNDMTNAAGRYRTLHRERKHRASPCRTARRSRPKFGHRPFTTVSALRRAPDDGGAPDLAADPHRALAPAFAPNRSPASVWDALT